LTGVFPDDCCERLTQGIDALYNRFALPSCVSPPTDANAYVLLNAEMTIIMDRKLAHNRFANMVELFLMLAYMLLLVGAELINFVGIKSRCSQGVCCNPDFDDVSCC
jgi:hypothetical protein